MTDTLERIDTAIDQLLKDHAPEGTLWVVLELGPTDRAWGPFDSYAEAFDWIKDTDEILGGAPIPLFTPENA